MPGRVTASYRTILIGRRQTGLSRRIWSESGHHGDPRPTWGAGTPRKGGPGLKRLPRIGLSPVRPPVRHAKHVTYTPPPIKLVFATPLPNEGVWHRTGPSVNGEPPVLVTTYRPSTEYPSILAYVL